MTKIDYVKIEDRVTTLMTVAGDLRVVNVMVGICCGKPRTECAAAVEGRAVRAEELDDEIERRATNIRRAMERLAEDVRELCAREADARPFAILRNLTAGGDDDIASDCIAAAIRELEL